MKYLNTLLSIFLCIIYLTTIGGPWYFDRAVVPQRLINQSLYQEILLLQKFNNISEKVLKPKKISLQPQKNKCGHFLFLLNWDLDLEKVFVPTSKMSNSSEVLIYLSFLLFLKEAII